MKKTYIAFLVCIVALASLITACTVTRLVETPPGSGQYKKVVDTDPRFKNGLDAANATNDATALINPWHGLVTIGLGAAAAIAEWNRRRKQAVVDAVITGVETAGDEATKKAINKVALAQKVEGDLNKSVQRVTGG